MITLSILTPDERKKILEASFRVLEETGVQIDHPEVFRKLGEAGCRGDEEKKRIFFPRNVVEEKAKLCPSQVRFADRKGGLFTAEPGGPCVFWTGNALNITRGKETRPIREEDFAAFCRVIDALPHIDGVVGTNLSEYPPGAKDFVGFRVMMENTRKHLRPCIYTPQGVAVIIEMAQAYLAETGEDLRSRPIVSTGYTIVSPLHWTREGLDVYVRSAGYGMPATINSECISGATSPVTLAGTLVLANAEALSGIVINQVLEPGRPVIYNLGFSHVMDMRTAEPTTGAPENGLLAAAGAAFARDLKLPSAAWHCSDSSCVDSQSAFEHALVGLVQLLGGANIIWGAGNLEFTRAISLEQAVIDNEIIYGAQRVTAGNRGFGGDPGPRSHPGISILPKLLRIRPDAEAFSPGTDFLHPGQPPSAERMGKAGGEIAGGSGSGASGENPREAAGRPRRRQSPGKSPGHREEMAG